MKYFIDFEFIESFTKPNWIERNLFRRKQRHYIELISVGIVSEYGDEYYAVSNEFNRKDADEWVNRNVIDPIEVEMYQKLTSVEKSYRSSVSFKELQRRFGKSKRQIKYDILSFLTYCTLKHETDNSTKLEFYGYYADYDWVVLCSLYGRMIDLPKGFPMYCRDLKQMLDDSVERLRNSDFISHMHKPKEMSFDEKMSELKSKNPKYPSANEKEHNALEDAKWNKRLYDFIKTIQ